MEMRMNKVLPALALAAAMATPALAQIVAGAPYEPVRAALLAKGWRPETSYGIKMRNGEPLYHYPEILCGPAICRAKWRDPSGHEHAIMLNRGINRDHTIAESQ
jgi:hypothetical protein